MTARIDVKCIDQLRQLVASTNSNYEIGGIILGKRNDNTLLMEMIIELPSLKPCSYSYSLDGNKASIFVNESDYDFVGIWHSHINSCNHFSEADSNINRMLAIQFSGIISVLVVQDEKKLNCISISIVDEEGNQYSDFKYKF